jgi:uncharacterized Zn finger protein (UPF0148 family)
VRCPECGSGWVDPTDPDVCPKCGHHFVSVADDSLDQLVMAASAPNLATLFRRAKESGAIESFEGYAGGPPA